MPAHRIICTEQEPANRPPTHAHIVAVGIGIDPASATNRLTLAEVLAAMDRGEQFFTQGERSGKIAKVVKAVCSHCVNHTIIKSTPDAVEDNNLDKLRYCRFK